MTSKRTLATSITNPGGYLPDQWSQDASAAVQWLSQSVISKIDQTTVAGTANAITANCIEPLIGSYVEGMTFRFVPTANNTTTVTVDFDGKGAKTLVQPDGTALASGDLVNGQPATCWYDSAADKFRLDQFSQRVIAANALAALSADLLMTLIGDTTIGSAVAQVEHTFTANTYSRIVVIVSGLSGSASSTQLVATLRNASGAVTSLSQGGFIGGGAFASADIVTAEIVFLLDLITSGSTKSHPAWISGGGYNSASSSASGLTAVSPTAGANATAPDRVRVAYSSGNIDAGRVMTYGFLA